MSTPFRPRVVSLFSGIGATDLALEHLGCETIAHSDIEPYANAVFAKRFPNSKQLGSVTDITEVPECEVMAGGFPCQDISGAGKGEGITGARSGLWKEFARLIGIAHAELVLIENVSMLLTRGIDVVLADLNELGYAAEWDCVPAAAVGAPHLRDRVWITAYPYGYLPVREDPLERALGTLQHPPSKWPRAGRMDQGAVYVREPVAKRKTKRLNPGSAWLGARLDDRHGWWHDGLLPSPTASMAERGGRGDLLQVVRGNPSPSGHFSVPAHLIGMWPTPVTTDSNGARNSTVRVRGARGGKGGSGGNTLTDAITLAHQGLWPTPRTSDMNGPGRHGTGGVDLRTAVAESSARPGHLNPRWVEWLMGYPLDWTDLSVDFPRWRGWNFEPRDTPRVCGDEPARRQRLHALGNGQVAQVMRWWAAPAIKRLLAPPVPPQPIFDSRGMLG